MAYTTAIPPAIETALTRRQRILKRAFDVTVAAALLALAAPLMTVIAIAVRLDSPGPAIFRQTRVGERGRLFRMYKFRTMVQDAESRQREVTTYTADGRPIHKRPNDPRITRLGHILRRTSLDELPQLVNVLKGDMSLVGPRPEMPWIVAQYEPWQYRRFSVPQGITGWWQINGRSDRVMHLHTEDDLYYIDNYSFWLDFKILLKTVRFLLSGKGAF